MSRDFGYFIVNRLQSNVESFGYSLTTASSPIYRYWNISLPTDSNPKPRVLVISCEEFTCLPRHNPRVDYTNRLWYTNCMTDLSIVSQGWTIGPLKWPWTTSCLEPKSCWIRIFFFMSCRRWEPKCLARSIIMQLTMAWSWGWFRPGIDFDKSKLPCSPRSVNRNGCKKETGHKCRKSDHTRRVTFGLSQYVCCQHVYDAFRG